MSFHGLDKTDHVLQVEVAAIPLSCLHQAHWLQISHSTSICMILAGYGQAAHGKGLFGVMVSAEFHREEIDSNHFHLDRHCLSLEFLETCSPYFGYHSLLESTQQMKDLAVGALQAVESLQFCYPKSQRATWLTSSKSNRLDI